MIQGQPALNSKSLYLKKNQFWNSHNKEHHKHKSNLNPALIEAHGILKSYRNITENLQEHREQRLPLERRGQ